MTNTKNKDTVSCNGSNSSKHPKIYLNFGDKKKIICPYCSQVFQKKK